MSSSKSTLSDITPFGLCCMLFLLHLLSFMCAHGGVHLLECPHIPPSSMGVPGAPVLCAYTTLRASVLSLCAGASKALVYNRSADMLVVLLIPHLLIVTTPDAHIVRSGKRHLKVTHFTPTV